MQSWRQPQPLQSRAGSCFLERLVVWTCMGLLACGVISTPAKPLVSTETPLAFFTNVAKRLLESELSLELNCIQVYTSNQYTPAVHRLLQVTANIYDSTTNRTFGVANAGEGF